MKSYLLLLRHGELKLARPDAQEQLLAGLVEWSERLATQGRLLAAERLISDNRLRVRKSADRLVIDGPFPESKELVIGMFIVRAANIAEAARLAGDCSAVAAGAEVEVREIADFPQPGSGQPLDDAG